jgi:hypothetical protein
MIYDLRNSRNIFFRYADRLALLTLADLEPATTIRLLP